MTEVRCAVVLCAQSGDGGNDWPEAVAATGGMQRPLLHQEQQGSGGSSSTVPAAASHEGDVQPGFMPTAATTTPDMLQRTPIDAEASGGDDNGGSGTAHAAQRHRCVWRDASFTTQSSGGGGGGGSGGRMQALLQQAEHQVDALQAHHLHASMGSVAVGGSNGGAAAAVAEGSSGHHWRRPHLVAVRHGPAAEERARTRGNVGGLGYGRASVDLGHMLMHSGSSNNNNVSQPPCPLLSHPSHHQQLSGRQSFDQPALRGAAYAPPHHPHNTHPLTPTASQLRHKRSISEVPEEPHPDAPRGATAGGASSFWAMAGAAPALVPQAAAARYAACDVGSGNDCDLVRRCLPHSPRTRSRIIIPCTATKVAAAAVATQKLAAVQQLVVAAARTWRYNLHAVTRRWRERQQRHRLVARCVCACILHGPALWRRRSCCLFIPTVLCARFSRPTWLEGDLPVIFDPALAVVAPVMPVQVQQLGVRHTGDPTYSQHDVVGGDASGILVPWSKLQSSGGGMEVAGGCGGGGAYMQQPPHPQQQQQQQQQGPRIIIHKVPASSKWNTAVAAAHGWRGEGGAGPRRTAQGASSGGASRARAAAATAALQE